MVFRTVAYPAKKFGGYSRVFLLLNPYLLIIIKLRLKNWFRPFEFSFDFASFDRVYPERGRGTPFGFAQGRQDRQDMAQDKKLMKSKPRKHRGKNTQGRRLFITFEGIEGCGKTTQINLLKRYLTLQGYDIVLTREPGGTAIGRKLKGILLSPENHQITPGAELLLYAADRSQHMEEIIRPALEEGKIILCDRFTDATIAYQGYARGIELKLIERLNRLATGGLKPNLTILLDCPVEVGLGRLSQRESSRWRGTSFKDRLEREGIDFHQRVRKGYLKIAEREPRRLKVVDAGREIEIVQAEIKGLVSRSLEKN